jgi:hypothetical protein
MAVMAARILLRERGSSIRSEAVTGFLVGPGVCGAAMAPAEEAAGAPCALTEAAADTHRKITTQRNKTGLLCMNSP